jgi:hypothetical protein
MRLRLFAVVSVLFVAVIAEVHAGIIPEKTRDELIDLALKNFWGKARLSNGQFVQPSSEAERNTVPLPKAVSYRVLDAGEVSGLAMWCKLDWEPHFHSVMQAARSKGLNDKQVAFVAVLHGAAQGTIGSAMDKSGPCDDRQRKQVERMLDQSRRRGLEDV